ncbi:MAG: branched-chain amino acid transport system substrate-binding protein [Paracoccaceae bacterium]|jgi:branched-chain amino acid transport system substrate-binding protein
MSKFSILLCALCATFSSGPLHADTPALELIIDADFSVSYQAARSIELGVRTALDEVQGNIGGLDFRIVTRDHHGNAKRSYLTLAGYVENENALAIIGGSHSPPYLTYQEFINTNRILTLLPWSAAGPITRSKPESENWFYRLSIDDSRAGGFIVDHATSNASCVDISLLLIDTGWGRSNRSAMIKALAKTGREPTMIKMVPTATGTSSAKAIANEIGRSATDCVIMVMTSTEGAHLVNALHEMAPDVTVYSHWGVLAQNFADQVTHQTRSDLGLRVIQTCGLQAEQDGNEVVTTALTNINRHSLRRNSLREIPSSVGFIHAYDLTHILIEAIQQAATQPEWQGDIRAKRLAVRHALENLKQPVPGILKTYEAPFSAYSPDRPNAHEALDTDDFCMTSFAADGLMVASSDEQEQ